MPSHYRQIQRIVLRARELRGVAQSRFVDEACGNDDELRREVLSLLAQERGDSASVLATGAGLVQGVVGPQRALPRRLGDYELVEYLGEGGMGVVYRAQQLQPIRREVAVKLIRWGFSSKRARLRFDAEREALSRMDHPGIAKVLDAGSDEDGSPFVVVELVHGSDVTRYCDEKRLDLRARVRLIGEICRAVHHAHQRGVIHRDLKPSNILIEEVDGRPLPRIIDFGIAKAVQGSLGGDQPLTVPGQLIGTPQYMSPEQVSSGGLAVDTRTDVYALGVLLFELLVGDTPLGRATLDRLTFAEVLGLVGNFEAPTASGRLRDVDAPRLQELAEARRASPKTMTRQLRGDLDWIVLRALEQDPERRYPSAADFAEDLDRYLRHEVVEAGPPSSRVKVQKFLRRNRAWVSGLAAVFLVLAAGVVTTSWQARRAAVQAERAEKRLEDVRRFVIDFAFDLDRQLLKLDGTAGARAFLVDETVRQLDAIVADGEAGSVLEPVLGDAYRRAAALQKDLGQSEESVRSFEVGISILKEYSREHSEDVETLRNLGVIHDEYRRALGFVGRKNEEVGVLRDALTYFQSAVDVDPTDQISNRYLNICRINLAGALFVSGEIDEAGGLYEKGLAWRRAAAREHPENAKLRRDLSRGLRDYSGFLWDTEDTVGAMAANEEMLTLARRSYEADPQSRLTVDALAKALSHYGWQLTLAGQYSSALALMEEGTATFEQLRDANPEMLRYEGAVGTNQMRTAFLYQRWGDWQKQLDFALQSEATNVAALERDPNNQSFEVGRIRARKLAGDAQLDLGRLDEALASLQSVVADWDRLLDRDRRGSFELYQAAEAKFNLGCVYQARAEAGVEPMENWKAAREWYEKSASAMDAIDADTGVLGYMTPLFGWLATKRAAADSAIGSN